MKRIIPCIHMIGNPPFIKCNLRYAMHCGECEFYKTYSTLPINCSSKGGTNDNGNIRIKYIGDENNMITVCLCKGVEYFDMSSQDIKNKFKLLETYQEIKIGVPFKYKGKYYSPAMIHPTDSFVIVHEFSLESVGNGKVFGESLIKCPACGHKDKNSYEHDGDDGEIICDICGSTFTWERQVLVSYTTELKESIQIEEIK